MRKAGERWSFTQRVWDFLFGGVFVDVFGGGLLVVMFWWWFKYVIVLG